MIKKMRLFFASKGDFISTEELNAYQKSNDTKLTWSVPIETKRLFRVLDFLADVVNDRITTKADDVVDYTF
jgi:hypothetical protein